MKQNTTNTLTVTRVTHSCVLLDFGGQVILTDPWFSEKTGYYRGEPLGVTIDALPELAGVVASHAHYDHYDMEAFQAYRDKQVPLVVKRGMAEAAHAVGFTNITEIEPWETAIIGSVKVTATPAKHGVPENTYVLEANGYTVFFGGDTLLIPQLSEVAQRFPQTDLALLAVNGLEIRPMFNHKVVMDAQDAAELCSILRPHIAIPIHYSFTAGPVRDRLLLKYTGNAAMFAEAAARRAPKTTIKVLAPGEPFEVSAIQAIERRGHV